MAAGDDAARGNGRRLLGVCLAMTPPRRAVVARRGEEVSRFASRVFTPVSTTAASDQTQQAERGQGEGGGFRDGDLPPLDGADIRIAGIRG